jgi:voltage-gated potassium channel Kch
MGAFRWAVLGALTVLATVLGIVGFERLPQGAEWSFGDSFHRSLQLFVLESGGVEPPVPWQLEVARVLAPALTLAAAALTVFELFRERVRGLAVRLRARDHVVVAGLGRQGALLALRLHEEGARVVAVERAAGAPAIASARARGIPVVVGDAADGRILAQAALARARELFVLCGEDGTNAGVIAAARRVIGAGGGLRAFVHLDDLDLLRHLQGHELASGGDSGVRAEFFNLADVAARMLLEAHPPGGSPHVVVSGGAGLAESVVLHAARERLDAGDGERLHVTVCGPDAEAGRARLLSRNPRLAAGAEVHAWELHPAAGGAPPAAVAEAPPPSAAYVAGPTDARAVTLALALRASGFMGEAPVVVAVRDEAEGVTTALRAGGGVVAFGVLTRAMTSELVTQGTTEVLARAKHAQYVRDELARGGTPATNPSIVAWPELSESLRQSNRAFAAGVGEKLRAAGVAVVPAPLADPATAPRLPEEQVEELAIAEHDRWCRDLVAQGWSHGPGPKDPERKLHPSLVPWDELSEEERDKDREPVRALPEMLARAGFELRAS